MDNQCHRCALTSSFFELVSPTTVIGHVVAGKQCRIFSRKTRVIDEHHHGFTFNIKASIVVPLVFWRHDAVTHKHHVRLFHFAQFSDAGGPSEHLLAVFKFCRRFFTSKSHARDCHRINPNQLHWLDITVAINGLQANTFKLLG